MDADDTNTTTTTTQTFFSPEERKRLIDSIPHASIIDIHKENIIPRKKGRSVSSLTSVLEATPAEREKMLQAGHDHFQQQLETLDEQDDPLCIYIDYIDWTIKMYPQGQSSDSNLIGLLKDATDHFKLDPRYKCDARYLKLWMEYSKWVDQPKEIFLYLIKFDIGQQLSLFYEEYSAYYEKLEKYDEAADVFQLGLTREAQPVKRLEKSYRLLKARVEERKERGLVKKHQQEAKIQMESLRRTGQRTMLGHKFESQSGFSVPANVYAGLESQHNPTASSSSLRNTRPFGNDQNIDLATATASSSSSAGFSVFKERSPPPRSSILPIASKTSSPRPTSLRITPSSMSRSENAPAIERFSGSTIPQLRRAQTPIVSSFQVYREEESEPARPLRRSYSAHVLSFSSGEESSISRIRKHPVTSEGVGHKRARHATTSEQVDSRLIEKFEAKRSEYFQSKNSKGELEFIAISKHLYKEKATKSFEELRLERYKIVPIECDDDERFRLLHEGLPNDHEPDLTTETQAAKKAVENIFVQDVRMTEEEKELTWTSPNQFPKDPRKSNRCGNENY